MMEPFYFGPESHRLFGVYHPASPARSLRVGVVLCSPVGQEYIRAHRALLRLAGLLADQGFDVLRFDYYGCGDSQGDFDQGSLRQWAADISTAIDELRSSGPEQVAMVGLRLGATLALLCAAQRGDIAAVACWEPVVQGADYLCELRTCHDAWLARSFAKPRLAASPQGHAETLGFPLTQALQTEYNGCDLRTITERPAPQVLIVDHENRVPCDGLAASLETMAVEVSRATLRYPRPWEMTGDPGSKGVVPVPALERLGAWMAEVFP